MLDRWGQDPLSMVCGGRGAIYILTEGTQARGNRAERRKTEDMMEIRQVEGHVCYVFSST